MSRFLSGERALSGKALDALGEYFGWEVVARAPNERRSETMRVFKATYKDRNGQPRESSKWYVEFSDHRETVRRLPGFTDRKQSGRIGLAKLSGWFAVCPTANRLDLALARWLETLPTKMRDVLARWGLIDAKATAAGKPLADHLKDFRAALLAKGNTIKHAEQTGVRLQVPVRWLRIQALVGHERGSRRIALGNDA